MSDKTAARDAEIRRLYEDGEPMEKLVSTFGITNGAIRLAVKRAGGQLRKRGAGRKVFDADTLAQMRDLWRSGESLAAIGRKIDTDPHVVKRTLLEMGERVTITARSRERHPSWRGGRIVDAAGYVMVKMATDDPFVTMASSNFYVREHRLIVARSLGRPLTPKETVHHRNGDKSDNRLENLELHAGRHGPGATTAHCPTCRCFESDTEVALHA